MTQQLHRTPVIKSIHKYDTTKPTGIIQTQLTRMRVQDKVIMFVFGRQLCAKSQTTRHAQMYQKITLIEMGDEILCPSTPRLNFQSDQ
ncbi:MAG: hypothetical protein RLZZ612_532 [Pseudomonadota bacterium]